MEYQLTVELAPPHGTPALDSLQRYGVAALLDEHLALLPGITRPDGGSVEPVDHRIAVHSGGAFVTWVLESPAFVAAWDSAQRTFADFVARSGPLAGWRVRECAPAAIRWDDGDGHYSRAESSESIGFTSDAERARRRAELLGDARHFQAFGLEAFGYQAGSPGHGVSAGHARLVAGALIAGMRRLTDGLFADIQALADADAPASHCDGLRVLGGLPPCYASHYTAAFAQRFLVTTVILGHRLCEPAWVAARCTAEALALHLLKSEAELLCELAGVADEVPLKQVFATLDGYLFDDVDHERLYRSGPVDPDLDQLPERLGDVGGLAFDEWFHVRSPRAPVGHPYFADDLSTGGFAD